jgi:flagellar biosynthesis/type III secretory pathway M-ring protein FliF/YscJ
MTIGFSLFISAKVTAFRFSTSSVAPGIWSIFIFLIFVIVFLMVMQVILKIIEIKDQKVNEQTKAVKITLDLDGMPVTVEAFKKDQMEEILQLAREMQAHQLVSTEDRVRTIEHSASISAEKAEVDRIG